MHRRLLFYISMGICSNMYVIIQIWVTLPKVFNMCIKIENAYKNLGTNNGKKH